MNQIIYNVHIYSNDDLLTDVIVSGEQISAIADIINNNKSFFNDKRVFNNIYEVVADLEDFNDVQLIENRKNMLERLYTVLSIGV